MAGTSDDDSTGPAPPARPRWNTPEEDESFARMMIRAAREATPVEPLTADEKATLRDLMLRAADTGNAEALERLTGFADNPSGFREFLRAAPAAD